MKVYKFDNVHKGDVDNSVGGQFFVKLLHHQPVNTLKSYKKINSNIIKQHTETLGNLAKLRSRVCMYVCVVTFLLLKSQTKVSGIFPKLCCYTTTKRNIIPSYIALTYFMIYLCTE